MHSSRMRTSRSLTVCQSLLHRGGRGGVCLGGGCLLWGLSAPGGCLLHGGVSALGVSAPGGVCLGGLIWGVSALGVCSWGVSALGESALEGAVCSQGGYILACTEADTPLLTESQTRVKA